MVSVPGTPVVPQETRCAECRTLLTADQDQVSTEDSVFCRPCFNNLSTQLDRAVAAQSENINYPMAALGGLLGGAIGVAVWWGFTVLTHIAFGLVAVVIGITVGKGITILSGHKRSMGLQILSVIISAVSFFYASYLVSRSLILETYPDVILPWIPTPGLFVDVLRGGFDFMDVVFLAIVAYQAWKIPAPFSMNQ